MLLKDEIKKGEIYGYGVDSTFDDFKCIVKILEINGELLTIECQKTKELDRVGSHMLTTIDRCREMYKEYKKEYKKIKSNETELDDHGQWQVKRNYKKLRKILDEVDNNE